MCSYYCAMNREIAVMCVYYTGLTLLHYANQEKYI